MNLPRRLNRDCQQFACGSSPLCGTGLTNGIFPFALGRAALYVTSLLLQTSRGGDCNICDQPATWLCISCDKLYCDKCSAFLHGILKNKYHELQPTAPAGPEQPSPTTPAGPGQPSQSRTLQPTPSALAFSYGAIRNKHTMQSAVTHVLRGIRVARCGLHSSVSRSSRYSLHRFD